LTDDVTALFTKLNATRMRSPAWVVLENETAFAAVVADAACTKEMTTGDATLSVRLALPVPALFVALRVTVDVPAAVGVPEIKPVVLFTVRPAGNPVAP